MKSRKYLNNWKLIVIKDEQNKIIKSFELDEKQRITQKLKKHKKRSLILAQIGFYQNEKLKKEVIQKMQKKKYIPKSNIISSSDQQNDKIESDTNHIDDENTFNYELELLNVFNNDDDFDIFQNTNYDYEKFDCK